MNARVSNLKNVGYTTWEKLIFNLRRGKSLKAEAAGHTIIGNISDQWGDLIGDSIGNRTFKVPNPMYFVPWLLIIIYLKVN
ncbi:Acid phosphatase [Handroanthus impetiginosus]|uniref:Acid phosphatase n=1 Tax=Handroanthus impetiginosus TaxID=429701 RepID=A0A2G9I9J9_9LAMI|nr:Acid phosphatase [Handroanthus impetiginosus]